MKIHKIILVGLIAGATGFFCGRQSSSPSVTNHLPSVTNYDSHLNDLDNGLISKSDINPNFQSPQESKSYILPKGISKHIDPQIWTIKGGIDADFAKELGISNDQVKAINEIATETLQRLSELEASHSELITDEKGGQHFQISPFDGSGVQDFNKSSLMSILKDDRASLIYDVMGRNGFFAYFGKYPQEIAIEDTPTPGGGMMTLLNVKLKHNLPKGTRGYGLNLADLAAIKTRFGALYKKAGLPLQ